MYIVLGGTGHVGSAVARTLLADHQPVTIVTRSAPRGEAWKQRGAGVAVADVHDVDALRAVFRGGKRAFLLNPPADPSTDTDAEERETVRCLLAALEGSGLEKVVAQSTYGARPGERCGDLTTLFRLEEGLRRQPIPAGIVRAAYYMSNWDAMLEPARDHGILGTMFPAGLVLPMVAPDDLGRVAAHLLTEPADRTGIHHVEGPERHASADVAAAFAEALGRPVEAQVTPRARWEETFRSLGLLRAGRALLRPHDRDRRRRRCRDARDTRTRHGFAEALCGHARAVAPRPDPLPPQLRCGFLAPRETLATVHHSGSRMVKHPFPPRPRGAAGHP